MVPWDERMEKVFQRNGTINKQIPSRASQKPKRSHFIYQDKQQSIKRTLQLSISMHPADMHTYFTNKNC